MSDNSEEPESKTGKPNPPKTKAEDNPWYLLATLFGVPVFRDEELRKKNRVAWNRYFAADLEGETRTKLIEEKRHPAEELTPFSPEELQEVATAFAERCKASAKKPALPASDAVVDFGYVEFDQDAFFAGCLFCGASFDDATFSDWAYFDDATFSFDASFERATFFRSAFFDGTTFFGDAYFAGANFSDSAWFDGATFCGPAYFGESRFGEEIRVARFGGTTGFVNAEMKGVTSFNGAIFDKEPPRFFGAKLHQGTVWRGIAWPRLPKSKDEAGRFIDAYACLKLEMDRLKKHEDELDFFAREMEARHALLGPVRGLPIAIYGVLSDYGRSYARPLVAISVVAAIGAWAFWYFDARTCVEALELSVANTLSVFGLHKVFNLSIATPFAWLEVVSAVQTILGAVLLFLVGLGVRNKFRMK